MSASVASMTGFARTEGRADAPVPFSWIWEVKSVNSKGLDIRLRVPHGLDALEVSARTATAKIFKRGALTLTLTMATESEAGASVISEAVLDALIELAQQKTKQLGPEVIGPQIAQARLDGLMSIAQGREQPSNLDSEAKSERSQILIAGLDDALGALAKARQEEGAELGVVVTQHLDTIARLCGEANDLAAVQPETLKAKLLAQVSELVSAHPALPEDKLIQEAALLAVKFDIREELDRLNAHIEQARELLAKGEPCGRRLDFLCQEFNREANTLCSKSSDIALTRIGLELKSTIDQLREQIQNIE